MKRIFFFLSILTLLSGMILPAQAAPLQAGVSAYELIAAMNSLRVSNGFKPLVEDAIIDAVAQDTASTMAANQLSSHIGNVSGRLAAAGFGGGSTVWGTENFAVGMYQSVDAIMQVWADPAHMLPATQGAYCAVGAATAQAANGFTYYILQAAYTSGKACGTYTAGGGSSGTAAAGGSTGSGVYVSQVIVPVYRATPGPDGKIFHTVQAGQSFWAIAIAYKLTIHDLEVWNNISRSSGLRIGQKLFIPGADTVGYSTPTPVGQFVPATPGADGQIVHTVQPYQTLILIAQAYGVSVTSITALNGILDTSPLQIGQKLLIPSGGNLQVTGTLAATLSPIQKLTPEDGNYYHVVRAGETLSWIANLYGVNLVQLMLWNNLDNNSILMPGQKLLLQITPPVTETPTPSITPTASATPSPTITATGTLVTPTLAPKAPNPFKGKGVTLVLIGMLTFFLVSFWIWLWKRKPA